MIISGRVSIAEFPQCRLYQEILMNSAGLIGDGYLPSRAGKVGSATSEGDWGSP